MLDLIANQDPDRLIKWEVDYPDNPEQFTPFLSTEMRVDETVLFIIGITALQERTR